MGAWTQPSWHSGCIGVHAALLWTGAVAFLTFDPPEPPFRLPQQPQDFGTSSTVDLRTGRLSRPAYLGENAGDREANLFCSGHALLADGRLLVVGGERPSAGRQTTMRAIHQLKPAPDGTEELEHIGQSHVGRWYCTALTMPDGRVFINGGSDFNVSDSGWEILDPSNGNITTPRPSPNIRGASSYPQMFVLPNERIFVHAGRNTLFFDTTTTEFADHRESTANRTYPYEGAAVLLPLRPQSSPPYKAEVLMIGGGEGRDFERSALASCEVLDTSRPSEWQIAPTLQRARVMPDAVLLPDGTVFVANGSATGIADHGPSPVYEGELYDPRRPERGWQLTAPMSFPRLYHATALLLPDATVMTAGTDATWNPAPYAQTGHRIEIYSPPYLFAGPRPVIERVESASEPCAHGAVLTVRSPDAGRIDEVVIVRASSVTHSTNTDQRLVELDFKQGDAATLEVTLPSGRGVAPPGIYLLFVLADGVPSEGRFLQFGATGGST